MGQVPFYPPNVKGWDGGKSWINTATLTFRYQLARQLVLGIRVVSEAKPKTAPQASPSPQGSVSAQPSASTQAMMAMEQNGNTMTETPNVMAQKAVRLPPLPVDALVTGEDRADPEAALRKLYARAFQTTPDPQLFSRILAVAKEKTLPLADDAIRDLVALIMMTPNYQVC
jgi:hypothetical protein